MRDANGRFVKSTEDMDKAIGVSFKGLANNLRSVSENFSRVGTSLSIGITLPLTLLARQIASIGFDYEKAMNTFQAVTKASATEMAVAAKVAQQLGADMSLPATSAGDAALAMTELAKGGFTAAQAMDAAKGALQLAAAAQVDEATAATITANALNTFHLAATESVKVSDLLAAASNASSAEITDIALAMQQAGASAAALHIPIQDLTTAIAEMANSGIKGSDAGTSLKTFMIALIPHTKNAAAAMKELGINAFDSQGHFVGLQAVIEQAAPALARMTDKQKQQAIQTAFGTDAQRAANIILGEGVEKWKAMSEAVGQGGAAAELAAAKTKGLSGAWEGLKSQLETGALKVFEQLKPSLESIVRGIADMSAKLSDLDPLVYKVGITLAAVFGSAGPAALGIAKLAALFANPLGLAVGAAIAGVALLSAAYVSNFGGMRDTVNSFAQIFSKDFGSIGDALDKTANVVDFLALGMTSLVDISVVGFKKMAAAAEMYARVQLSLFTGQWKDIPSIVEEGTKRVEAASAGFAERNQRRVDEMQKLVEGGWRKHFEYLAIIAGKGGADAADNLTTQYMRALDRENPGEVLRNALERGKGPTIEAARILGQQSGEAALKGWRFGIDQHSPSGFEKDLDRIYNAFVDFPDKLASQVAPKLKNAGKQMLKDMREAFNDTISAINDYVRSTDSKAQLTAEIWGRLSKDVRKSLIEQTRAFKQHEQDMQIIFAGIAAQPEKVIPMLQNLARAHAAANKSIASGWGALLANYLGFGEGYGQVTKKIIVENANLASSSVLSAKTMAAAYGLAWQTFAVAAQNALAKNKEAMAKLDADWRSLNDSFKDLGGQIPLAWNKVIDGILNASGRLGEDLVKLGVKVKGWARDVVGVIDTIPGKFGDAARGVLRTVDQWAAFFDKILGLLHRFNSSIPATIEDAIGKIVGIFKGAQSGITSTVQGVSGAWDAAKKATTSGSAAIGSATSGMSEKVKNGFGVAAAAAGGFAASLAISANSSSKAMGFLESTISSTLAGIAAGFAFGPVAGAITAGVSLLGGIIGLFKGKSAQQKEQERLNNEKLKADIAASAQATMNAALEGFQKALTFLESLDQFTAPRKIKFQQFFNKLSKLMDWFVDLAKKWQGENLEKDKAVAEAIGAVAEGLAKAPAAFDAINSSFTIPDSAFDVFFNNLDRFMERFFQRSDVWIEGTAKRAKKVADRLASVVDLISPFTEGIKSIIGLQEPADADLDVWDRTLQKMIARIGAIADQFDKGWLKTLAFFSEKAQAALGLWKDATDAIRATVDVPVVSDDAITRVVSGIESFITKLIASAENLTGEALNKASAIAQAILPIAAAVKAWAEAANLIKDYSGVANDTWDKIIADFNRTISLINLMLGSAIDFTPKAEQFESVMKTISDHLKAGLDLLGNGLLAAASAFGGLVNTLSGGATPGTVLPGGGDSFTAQSFGGSSFAASSYTPAFAGGGGSSSQPIVMNFYGDVHTDQRFYDRVRQAVEHNNKRGAA